VVSERAGSARANRAHHRNSFASSLDGNGQRDSEKPPKPKPKKAAPVAGKLTGTAINGQRDGNSATAPAQARKRTGSEPAEAEPCSILKIDLYGKGGSYTRILNDTLRDPRIAGLPLTVLCYALSMPRNWQIRSWHLRQVFGCGEQALRSAIKRLVEAGYARMHYIHSRSPHGSKIVDRCWQFRESPKLQWLPSIKRGQPVPQETHVTKKDCPLRKGVGSGKSGVQERLNLKRKPKGQTGVDGRGKPRSFSFGSFPFPKSAEAITRTLQAEGIEIPPAIVQRFYADMQRSQWTTGRDRKPVRDWLATLLARWEKIKARLKRGGRLLSGDIDALKARAARLTDRRGALYHQDRKGTEQRRAKLQASIDVIDHELARRKVNVEAERLGRAARRSQRDHEAVKHLPVIPEWLHSSNNGNGAKPDPTRQECGEQEYMQEAKAQKSGRPDFSASKGQVLNGKFLTDDQANRLAQDYPQLITKLRKATRLPDGRIILQPQPAL
jgi:hypothetical protein